MKLDVSDMRMETIVFNLDDLLNHLKIDPNKPFFISVANSRNRIIASGKPIPHPTRYNGKIAMVFLTVGFIIGHQDGKAFYMHYNGDKERPLMVLGYLADMCDDPTYAKLLDHIDMEYVDVIVMNLDDPLQLAGMREENPKELDGMLAFFNKV